MIEENKLFNLNSRLTALSVFRGILETPVVSEFQKLISALEGDSLAAQLRCLGAFSNALYLEGGNLSSYIREQVLYQSNPHLAISIEGGVPDKCIVDSLRTELEVIQQLSDLDCNVILELISCDTPLPHWSTSSVDISGEYFSMLKSIATNGYGMFAKHMAFKVTDGRLIPVKHVDEKPISALYGYERERNKVYANTEALADGRGASNVLLYGDAGTGKSSTIKGCAAAFFPRGVRLIEFSRNQLTEIPAVMEQLYSSPLKFIFYIDDLTFNENDENFSELKGILEGNVCGESKNIAVYATSNRRHLVKESAEARLGSDLHLNDTLQETMSLSSRFGLTITFSKPEKDLYLEIVKSIAEERDLPISPDLFQKAEAFAIRSNGRSPRTAQQFIQLYGDGIL